MTMDSGPITAEADRLPTPAGQVPGAPAPVVESPPTRRHVILLAVAVAAVAGLALLLVVAASRPVTQFAADSPEGAFQAYLVAWDARDLDAAYATFSERVQGSLSPDEYRMIASGYDGGGERRVVLLASAVHDDRATLDLRIDELGGGGLFGGQSVYSSTITVDLVRENGSWRLDTPFASLEPVYWYAK